MRVVLPNGLVLEGSESQVVSTARQLGFSLAKDFYLSESKGYVHIKNMNTTHLRNAILKQYRGWVASLSVIRNPRILVTAMMEGLTDATWLAMVKEYAAREEE